MKLNPYTFLVFIISCVWDAGLTTWKGSTALEGNPFVVMQLEYFGFPEGLWIGKIAAVVTWLTVVNVLVYVTEERYKDFVKSVASVFTLVLSAVFFLSGATWLMF